MNIMEDIGYGKPAHIEPLEPYVKPETHLVTKSKSMSVGRDALRKIKEGLNSTKHAYDLRKQ